MNWRAGGLRSWLLQRVSAVYLAVFVLVAIPWALWNGPENFAHWRAVMGYPAVTIAVLLFFVALLGHAWVGMRDVVIDYVRPAGLRLFVLGLIAVALVTMGLWAAVVLFSVVRL